MDTIKIILATISVVLLVERCVAPAQADFGYGDSSMLRDIRSDIHTIATELTRIRSALEKSK